jgi:glycosyltransferase involved in cell wall biosynthesis
MMRVLALTRLNEHNGALSQLRLGWPMGQLNKFGFKCEMWGKERVQKAQPWEFANCDALVLQRDVALRDAKDIAPFFDMLKNSGVKVIYETDDDTLDQSRFGYEEWVRYTISRCDAITVSTKPLAERMAETGKPAYYLPNCLDTGWFSKVSKSARRIPDFEGKVVFGLIGTRSHWGDWVLVLDAIKRIIEDYGEQVIFVTAGYYPPYLEDSIEQWHVIPPVPYEKYPGLMRQFDIVLCPLDTSDPFNHYKSAISALDAMAAEHPVGRKAGGAVPVCTDCSVYRKVIRGRRNGILVNGDWYGAISELIEDEVLRQNIAVRGLAWVKKNRDIGRHWDKWADAYREIGEMT